MNHQSLLLSQKSRGVIARILKNAGRELKAEMGIANITTLYIQLDIECEDNTMTVEYSASMTEKVDLEFGVNFDDDDKGV